MRILIAKFFPDRNYCEPKAGLDCEKETGTERIQGL
jgi:hypothetical protein